MALKTKNIKILQTCVISLGVSEHPETSEPIYDSVTPPVGWVLQLPADKADAIVADGNAAITDEAPTEVIAPTTVAEANGGEDEGGGNEGEGFDDDPAVVPDDLPTDYVELQALSEKVGLPVKDGSRQIGKAKLIEALEAKRKADTTT